MHAPSPSLSRSRSSCQSKSSWLAFAFESSLCGKGSQQRLLPCAGGLERCPHGHRPLHPYEGLLCALHGRGLSLAQLGTHSLVGTAMQLCRRDGSLVGPWSARAINLQCETLRRSRQSCGLEIKSLTFEGIASVFRGRAEFAYLIAQMAAAANMLDKVRVPTLYICCPVCVYPGPVIRTCSPSSSGLCYGQPFSLRQDLVRQSQGLINTRRCPGSFSGMC